MIDANQRHVEQLHAQPQQEWKDIFRRVWSAQSRDNVSIVAAGVALYFLLAFFPMLAALVSIFGLVADPQQIEAMFKSLAGFLPAEGADIIQKQLQDLVSSSPGSLGLGLVISLGVALWSASRGMASLISALNIVYDKEEKRGFIKLNLIALFLTISAILFLLLTLALVVVIPAVIYALGLEGVLEWTLHLVRWPILAIAAITGMAVLYRYAPCRNQAGWKWINWGAVLATTLWMLGSVAFSIYVSNFGSYNKTYGSIGAVEILLLWFNLTAYAILIGGELNFEMEHPPAHDKAEGVKKPIGRRKTYVADDTDTLEEVP